jgi:transcriptional regulator with XRE-family HTH domain
MKFDAAAVRCRREARGLTQRELGAIVGVTNTTICRLERGDRIPHAATCARIAQTLGIPLERILHD